MDKMSYLMVGHFGLDFLDDLSIFVGMAATELSKDLEKRLLDLGAPKASVFKWRRRGVPAAWRLKLLESAGAVVTMPPPCAEEGIAPASSPFPTEADA
jgi:hypothetical protein